MGLTEEDVRNRVASVPYWFHSIDLGHGIVTRGEKTAELLARELIGLRLPDLRGKTVLDVNTWDGFYAFEAERRGASAVTALDFYMWAMDQEQHTRYYRECRVNGVVPKPYHEMPYYLPQELPGKRGFDVARQVLDSRVRPIVADFMEIDLARLGTFDVVLFLGTLYHMENPLESLRRLSAVTRELAVIESEAVLLPGVGDRAVCEFFESNELNHDVSNWWSPNERALTGMCRAAGFRRVDVLVPPPAPPKRSRLRALLGGAPPAAGSALRYRLVAHAWK